MVGSWGERWVVESGAGVPDGVLAAGRAGAWAQTGSAGLCARVTHATASRSRVVVMRR